MKTVKEVAVKLDNKPGALSQVAELLGADGINITGLTMRTEGTTGTANVLTTDPARTEKILAGAGLSPVIQEVLAVEIPHHPGGFNTILKVLKSAGVNVEYFYACFGFYAKGERTILIMGVDDTAKASKALGAEWIQMYGEELHNF
jgi:hypothetical protein